mgnify:CR=1 FL=1
MCSAVRVERSFSSCLPPERMRWRVGEQVRRAVTDSLVLGAYRVTLSVGVAWACPGDSPGSLVARADGALYRAKSFGRNQTVAAASPL